MTLPSNSCRLLCSAMARRLSLSAGSSCRARSSAAAAALSLALARLPSPPRSPPDDGSEAAVAAPAPPAPSPPSAGASAAAPSLAGTLADRPSAGHPAGAPIPLPADPAPACVAPGDAAGAAEASGRVPASGAADADTAPADLAAALRNFDNFASGIGPSTRPCHPGASCFLKCPLQNTSHPATRPNSHCAPRPSAQVRAKHFVGSMVSGVKRRHSSESARDGPARGSTPAGAWSAAAEPAPVPASSSSASPAAP